MGKWNYAKKLCKPYVEMKKSWSCKCTENVHLQNRDFYSFMPVISFCRIWGSTYPLDAREALPL